MPTGLLPIDEAEAESYEGQYRQLGQATIPPDFLRGYNGLTLGPYRDSASFTPGAPLGSVSAPGLSPGLSLGLPPDPRASVTLPASPIPSPTVSPGVVPYPGGNTGPGGYPPWAGPGQTSAVASPGAYPANSPTFSGFQPSPTTQSPTYQPSTPLPANSPAFFAPAMTPALPYATASSNPQFTTNPDSAAPYTTAGSYGGASLSAYGAPQHSASMTSLPASTTINSLGRVSRAESAPIQPAAPQSGKKRRTSHVETAPTPGLSLPPLFRPMKGSVQKLNGGKWEECYLRLTASALEKYKAKESKTCEKSIALAKVTSSALNYSHKEVQTASKTNFYSVRNEEKAREWVSAINIAAFKIDPFAGSSPVLGAASSAHQPAASSVVLWHWKKDDGNFEAFSPAHDSIIEAAFQDKDASCIIETGDPNKPKSFKRYRIVLEGEAGYQENLASGHRRDVQRLSAALLNQPKTKNSHSTVFQVSQKLEYPSEWENPKDKGVELVAVRLASKEAKTVIAKVHETMPNAKVSKIERVQHAISWSAYHSSKSHLANKYNGTAVDSSQFERWLFHGTSSTPPSAIYSSEGGFIINHANSGMWGRGVYFAVNSSYSDGYAYKDSGSKQFFLARVLVGVSAALKSNSALKVPPLNSKTNLQHDSVTGVTGGSEVFILYDNSRAYPAYLITYS